MRAAWESYLVKQGDYLSLIARQLGFADWRTIYDHPANENFRRLRPAPNVLKPGDMLFIPDKQQRSVDAVTGKQHRFRVRLPAPPRLQVFLRRADSQAIAEAPYTLLIYDAIRLTGTTDGDGKVAAAMPPGVKTAVLTLDRNPWMAWQLDVGHLDGS